MQRLIHKASGELEVVDPFLKAGLTLRYRGDTGSIWYTTEETLEKTMQFRSIEKTRGPRWPEPMIYVVSKRDGDINQYLGLIEESNIEIVDG